MHGLERRATWGLVIPSRNTVAEAEFHRFIPPGISLNTARADVRTNVTWADDGNFKAMAKAIRAAEPAAVESLTLIAPDRVVIAEGGFSMTRAEHDTLEANYAAIAKAPMTASCGAYLAALSAVGVKRVGVVTPRLPESGIVSGGLWDECGYTVTKTVGLGLGSAREIAYLPPETLKQAVKDVAASGAEAVLVTGTNFCLFEHVDALEAATGKIVLHINAVLMWHALRLSGFKDKVAGGVLLRQH
jgi:maleate isomerase